MNATDRIIVEGNMREVEEHMIDEVIAENSTFATYANHPERIWGDGRMRRSGDKLIIVGTANYRDRTEKVMVVIKKGSEFPEVTTRPEKDDS